MYQNRDRQSIRIRNRILICLPSGQNQIDTRVLFPVATIRFVSKSLHPDQKGGATVLETDSILPDTVSKKVNYLE
jgi:hypothetical protein